MWSDKELDDAFRRLNPPEPEAEPFPLDAWLRLEQQLDKQVLEREVRRRLWRFLALEMLVVGVGALLWLLWPTQPPKTLAGGVMPAETSTDTALPAPNPPAASVAAAGSPIAKPAVPSTPQAVANSYGAVAANTIAQQSATSHARQPADSLAAPTVADEKPVATNQSPSLAGRLAAAAGLAYHPMLPEPPARPRRMSAERLTAIKMRPPQRRRRAVMEAAVASRRLMAGRSVERNSLPPAVSRQHTSAGLLRRPASPHPATPNAAGRIAATAEAAGMATPPSSLSASTPASAAPAGPASMAAIQPLPVVLQTGKATVLPAPLATVPVALSQLPEPLPQPRIYLGLLAAPDVSTVKMADFQAPTPNVGLLLEYRLTQRLRVSTGLLRGTKQYRARRQDYDWSYYPRGATGTFEWVDGRCTILDLPLNLRYDVLARPRYQVFGAAGLSSLFMQHETYAYDYEYYGRQYRWESNFTNDNQHWFSVLNLSVGYERNLGRHWRLQAEPYLKLPLGGVGAGKVRLMSGGVFFGVKYGL